MVHEAGIPILNEWLMPALQWFGIISAALIVLGVLGGFLVSAGQHGPTEGFYRTAKTIFNFILADLPGFSPRRALAIAWLALQESIRKRVLFVVLGVFLVLLVFGGWFLDTRNDDPAKVYLTFVLGSANWLVLLMSIFLATLSLPNDMKTKTIYTIVTKPVRASEIVFGRMLGFIGIGTFLLAVMGLLGYVFVTRGLSHSHAVNLDSITEVRAPDETKRLLGYRGRTTKEGLHDHGFEMTLADGVGVTTETHGHTHEVVRKEDGTYQVGPPQGWLESRVPIYGKLTWYDRNGRLTDRGINVGNEWEYRHFIAGGSKAAAVWRFSGLTRERFPNGIPLEFTLRVFRTYKGDIEKPVLGSLQFRNPDVAKQKESAPFYHRFKEYTTDHYDIPLKVPRLADEDRVNKASKERRIVGEYDLFDDLVSENGELEVIVQCMEQGQYYGAAQADVYIRATDRPFMENYLKGLLTQWLQMTIIVCFGVFFSTFLSGPVAFLGTISVLVVGFFMSFIREIVHGIYNPNDDMAYKGGGPIESIIRIMTQQNIQTDLQLGEMATKIVKGIDTVFAMLLYSTTFVVPSFEPFNSDEMGFDTIAFVAQGYNIDGVVITILLLKAAAYALGTTLMAYFIFKTREVAAA